LQAWIVWKMLLPFLKSINDPAKLLMVSFVISWTAVYWMDLNFFSSYGAIALLPAFIWGVITPVEVFQHPSRRIQVGAALIQLLLVITIVSACYIDFPRDGSFTMMSYMRWISSWRSPHRKLALSPFFWCQLALLQLVHAVGGSSFLFMMPAGHTRITDHGRNTLYSYLGQVYFMRLLVATNLSASASSVCGLLLISPFLTFFMTSPTWMYSQSLILQPTFVNILFDKPYIDKHKHAHSLLSLALLVLGLWWVDSLQERS